MFVLRAGADGRLWAARTGGFAFWECYSAAGDGVHQILELSRNLGLFPALVVQEEAAGTTSQHSAGAATRV